MKRHWRCCKSGLEGGGIGRVGEVTTVVVQYHREVEGWWAESGEIPGFTAVGTTLGEVRDLVKSGLPYYLDDDIELLEQIESPEAAVVQLSLLSGGTLVSIAPQTFAVGGPLAVAADGPRYAAVEGKIPA